MAKKTRRTTGILPKLWKGIASTFSFIFRHPQPVAAALIVAGVLSGVWYVMKCSSAFTITNIEVPSNISIKVPDNLIGQNLWSVDLQGLAYELKKQQPNLKRLRVIRVLPNTLKVDALERRPISQLQMGKWYAMDADGFILPDGKNTPWDGLVALKGIGSPRSPLKVGKENSSERIEQALRIVEHITSSSYIGAHKLTALDISDPNQLNLTLDDAIQIRCGSEEELTSHLQRLKKVFRIVAAKPVEINYIDVRFKEPVIGPKT